MPTLAQIELAISLARKIAPREIVALELRAEGRSFTDIGEQMGVSRQRAFQIVTSGCSRVARLALLKRQEIIAIQEALGVEEQCT